MHTPRRSLAESRNAAQLQQLRPDEAQLQQSKGAQLLKEGGQLAHEGVTSYMTVGRRVLPYCCTVVEGRYTGAVRAAVHNQAVLVQCSCSRSEGMPAAWHGTAGP